MNLVFDATHRETERPSVGVHVGIAIEVEGASIHTINRTAPIVAEGTDTDERTIVV